MTIQRFMAQAAISALGDDQVSVIMSTAALARDGHVLLPQGCRLEEYRKNPIVLFSHDPMYPIGNAENIAVSPSQISCNIRFAPTGVSPKADEVRGLMKAGVLRCVSVGFDPIEMEPLNPSRPKGGQRISVWNLLELSAVAVPADAGAIVTARSQRSGGASPPHPTFRERQTALLQVSGATASEIAAIPWDDNLEHVRRQIDVLLRKVQHRGADSIVIRPRVTSVRATPPTRAERMREVARLAPSSRDREDLARAMQHQNRVDAAKMMVAHGSDPEQRRRDMEVRRRTPKR